MSTGKKLAFALTLVILLVGVAELICRAVGAGGANAVAHYISDWHETPDGRTFWVVRGEGYNADGMRDRTHAVDKPPGVRRIVCLGDSVTVGHGVARSQSYPFLFESFLKQLGLPVEVFNIAVSGWSTRQEATAYRAIVRRYRPDHIFLGFCLNDVAEMQNNLTAPPHWVMSILVRRSALVRWALHAESRQIEGVEQLFDEFETEAVRDGWERVFADLLALRDDTRADGCDLSVVMFPFRFQLAAGAPPPLAQRKLFAFCHAQGIPCLDLLPALREMGQSAFIDDSHLSPAGARVVAEEFIRWGRSGCMMCGHDLSEQKSKSKVCPRCGHPITP